MGRLPGGGGIRGWVCRQSEVLDTWTGSDGRFVIPLGCCHRRGLPAEALPSSSLASSPNLDGLQGPSSGASALGEPGGGAHRGGSACEGLAQSWRQRACSHRGQPGRGAETKKGNKAAGAQVREGGRLHEPRRDGREGRTTTNNRPPADQRDAEGAPRGREGGPRGRAQGRSGPAPSARQKERSSSTGSALRVGPDFLPPGRCRGARRQLKRRVSSWMCALARARESPRLWGPLVQPADVHP